MHKLGLGNTKFNSTGPSPTWYGPEGSPEYHNACAIAERCRCEAEVVDIQEGNAFWEVDMERGDIDYK